MERTGPESFRARSLQVSITVKDLDRSVAWYRDVLGFTVDRKIEREGRVVATALVAGDVRLLLNQDDGKKGWNRGKFEGVSLQFTTAQSVDAIAQHIKDSGWKLETEPADMPWGVRAFRVRDPDGFLFSISSERMAG
jgi:uncharacterized glyoxalase superfamily protein PhnB